MSCYGGVCNIDIYWRLHNWRGGSSRKEQVEERDYSNKKEDWLLLETNWRKNKEISSDDMNQRSKEREVIYIFRTLKLEIVTRDSEETLKNGTS